jgi:putative PIN family toxin of toxin-antitoxin system
MRAVLDTNILLSALFLEDSPPGRLITAWRRGAFTLVSAELQFDELRRATRYPKIRERIRPALAGSLVNELKAVAEIVDRLPAIDLSSDPFDNFLLAIAEAGRADYLVSGHRRGLLNLARHGACSIVTARDLLDRLAK